MKKDKFFKEGDFVVSEEHGIIFIDKDNIDKNKIVIEDKINHINLHGISIPFEQLTKWKPQIGDWVVLKNFDKKDHFEVVKYGKNYFGFEVEPFDGKTPKYLC